MSRYFVERIQITKRLGRKDGVETKENLCNFVVLLENCLIYNALNEEPKWKQGEYFRNAFSF